MDSSKSEVIAQYTKVTKSHDHIMLEVAVIDWKGPHTPEISWLSVKTFPLSTPEDEIAQAKETLLYDEKYFGRCVNCGKYDLINNFISKKVCFTCAEKDYGIIF